MGGSTTLAVTVRRKRPRNGRSGPASGACATTVPGEYLAIRDEVRLEEVDGVQGFVHVVERIADHVGRLG